MDDRLVMMDLIEQALREKSEIRISAIGGSMLPLIRPGQAIRIQRCSPGEVGIGDIVLVKTGDFFILHRVHRIENRRGGEEGIHFLTRGDATLRYDLPVEGASVFARVMPQGKNVYERRCWFLLDGWLRFYSVCAARLQERLSGFFNS